jgi:hypothetical protein
MIQMGVDEVKAGGPAGFLKKSVGGQAGKG